MPTPTPELFHRLAEPASARVRKRMTELAVRLELRNIAFDSHREDFEARGGSQTPAIWDGSELHSGEAACLSFVERAARG